MPRRCPTPEQLEILLGEQTHDPEVQALAAHVQECPACQGTLDRIAGGQGIGRPQQADADSGADFLRRLEQHPPTEARLALHLEYAAQRSQTPAGVSAPATLPD